jgi:hypothetical protein
MLLCLACGGVTPDGGADEAVTDEAVAAKDAPKPTKATEVPRGCEGNEAVSADWPVDDFCPDGTRLDPWRASHLRDCYRVGTACTRHGPYERIGDEGEVYDRGRYTDGVLSAWRTIGKPYDGYVYIGDEEGQRLERRSDGVRVLSVRYDGETSLVTSHVGEAPRTVRVSRRLAIDDMAGVILRPSEVEPPLVAASAPALSIGNVDELQFLDADPANERVAMKWIRKSLDGSDDEPLDCGYAGMQDDPKAGVSLGVYDQGEVQWYTIYALVNPELEDAASMCTSSEESSRNLAAAKAHFARLELDVSDGLQMREAISRDEESRDGPWVKEVGVAGRTVRLTTQELSGSDPTSLEDMLYGAHTSGFMSKLATWEGVEAPAIHAATDTGGPRSVSLELQGGWEQDGAGLVVWKGCWLWVRCYFDFIPIP